MADLSESSRTVDPYGNIRWFNTKGVLHRLDGPAIEYTDGSKIWVINGECHKLDGPAIYDEEIGHEVWYFHNKCYDDKLQHPFNIFRNEYKLSKRFEDWPNNMKVLFKLTYG